jgi:hypothetical protein
MRPTWQQKPQTKTTNKNSAHPGILLSASSLTVMLGEQWLFVKLIIALALLVIRYRYRVKNSLDNANLCGYISNNKVKSLVSHCVRM